MRDGDTPAGVGVGQRPGTAGRGLLRRMRPGLGAVAAALVLAAAGSAPPPSPALTEIGFLATSAQGQRHLLADGRLFVAGIRPQQAVLLSAYQPGSGERLWSVEHEGDVNLATELRYAEGVLLAVLVDGRSGQIGTTAFSAADGTRLWSRPGQVIKLDGRTGLVTEQIFPPGSRLAGPDFSPESFDGEVYHDDSTGETYAESEIGTTAYAIDLRSNGVLWSAPNLTSVTPIPGVDPGLLVVAGDGATEVWDPRTRVVRHRLDGASTWLVLDLIEEVMLLARGEADVTGYSAGTLRPVWQTTLPGDGWLDWCGELLCYGLPSGLRAGHPGTGAVGWRIYEAVTFRRLAGHLVERELDTGAPPSVAAGLRRTVRPETGETVGDLTGWQTYSTFSDGSASLLTRRAGGGPARTWIGLLEPGATSVRVLGVVPYGLSACAVGEGVVVCRVSSGGLGIWRLRT